jgi:hypothetical protein
MPDDTCDFNSCCCAVLCWASCSVLTTVWIIDPISRQVIITNRCQTLPDHAIGCHNFMTSLDASQFKRATEATRHGEKVYTCPSNKQAVNVVQLNQNGALKKELQAMVDTQPCNFTGIAQYKPYWKYQPQSFNDSTWSLTHPEKYPQLVPYSEAVCIPNHAVTDRFYWKQQSFNPKLDCQDNISLSPILFLYGAIVVGITALTVTLIYCCCIMCEEQPLFKKRKDKPQKNDDESYFDFNNMLHTLVEHEREERIKNKANQNKQSRKESTINIYQQNNYNITINTGKPKMKPTETTHLLKLGH